MWALQIRARTGVLALFLLSLASPGAASADATPPSCADQVVARLQARYENVRDLAARFEQETRTVSLGNAVGAGPAASRGRVVFAKPGRMRWSYEEPSESLVVTDGETLWIYDPAAAEVQRLPTAGGHLSGAALQFMMGEGDIHATFDVAAQECEIAAEGPAGTAVLELTPREPASYERLVVRLKATTGEILETTVVDLFGNRTRIAFSDMQVNQKPAATLFVFDAPEGVEVIDLALPR